MKNFKSLAALTAASMISLASVATPIFAAEGSTPTFNTTLTTHDGHHPATATTFSYTITPAIGDSEWSETAAGGTIFNGEVAPNLHVEADAAPEDVDTTKDIIEYTQSRIVCDNVNAFKGAGVFKYTISADAKTGDNYHGVTVDTKTYDLYVNVELEGTNKVIKSYTFRKAGTDVTDPAGKEDDLVFAHEYDTYPLTVSKTVGGNQGNKAQKFDFTLTVTKKPGQTFTIKNNNNQEITPATSTADDQVTYIFKLADSEFVTIDGLTADDIYTVEEQRAGYEAKHSINDAADVPGSKAENIAINDGQEDKIKFTNTKDGNVPTGILMTAAPYVAVVGLGGVFAGMFFRRKRED